MLKGVSEIRIEKKLTNNKNFKYTRNHETF